MKNKILKPEKGVSLIITFFVMIIILSVALSISALLYSEIKVIRNVGNSMVSLYAADSGIEKVLYYDRQVVPDGAVRGICAMFDQANGNRCADDPNPTSPNEHSIYCKNSTPSSFTGTCAKNVCTDCTITFDSEFDGRKYYITAKVYSYQTSSAFEIDSRGVFVEAQRQIKTLILPVQAQ